MTDETQQNVRKIRTFADDFARSQSRAGVSETTKENSEKVTVKIPPAPPKKSPVVEKSIPIPIKQKQITPAPKQSKNLLDDVSDIEVGSIVRDTKRERFRLFPAIGASVSSWFESKKEEHKATSMAVPTVTAPTSRKETIASAAALGVLPETNDYQKIANKISSSPKREVRPTVSIAGKESEPAPSWGTSTEEESAASEVIHDEAVAALEKAVSGSQIEEEKRIQSTESNLTVESNALATDLETPPEVKSAKVTSINNTDTDLINEEINEENETDLNESEATIEELEPELVNQDEYQTDTETVTEIPDFNQEEVFTPSQPRYQYRSSTSNINTGSGLFVLLIVILVALIAGVFGTISLYNHFTKPEVAQTTPVSTVVSADEKIHYLLDGDLRSRLTELANSSPAGTQVFYPAVITSESSIVQASITELLAQDDFGMPASFSRSLTEFNFGTLDNEPFIILVTSNFDTAFVGMLEWESEISDNLGFWFGEGPTTSFTDTTSSNRDIRVAKHSDGSELLYTFINHTTIVITNSRNVLEKISGRVNN